MRYITDPEEPDQWVGLDEIRKRLPPGKWAHSRVLEEVDVAIETGKTPEEFWALSRSDQAWVIARSRVKRTMAAYEDLLQSKKKPG